MQRIVLIALASLATTAQAAWTQAGDSVAFFDAQGPGGFKIHGSTKKVSVVDDGKQLAVSVSILDIDTDNSLRNRHLQEDTQAATLPTVSLTVPLESLKAPANGSATEGKANGVFAFHGQTNSVEFQYRISCKADSCQIDGTAPLNLSDFGVKVRSYLGITVKPDIRIGASFTLRR